jgi:hypothetical protein
MNAGREMWLAWNGSIYPIELEEEQRGGGGVDGRAGGCGEVLDNPVMKHNRSMHTSRDSDFCACETHVFIGNVLQGGVPPWEIVLLPICHPAPDQ